MKYVIEVAGWYGAIAIIVAYALNSFGLLSSSDLLYQLLNLTGAAGIVIVSVKRRAYQPAVVNLVWLLVAIIAIGAIFLKTM